MTDIMIIIGKRSPINSHRCADDDLMVGSINPLELFLIYHKISRAMDSNDLPASATAKAFIILRETLKKKAACRRCAGRP